MRCGEDKQGIDGNNSSELLITDELSGRPSQRNIVDAELAALRLMARHMATSPQDLLPAFVKLAMELTAAAASGLALIHGDELIWTHLHGVMQPFENVRSPRTLEVTAIVAGTFEPALLAHPERAFPWVAEAGLIFPEALVIPLRIAGAYAGALWVGSAGPKHFDNGDARLLSELSEFVGLALQVTQEMADLRHLLERQEMVAAEMGHRLKNLFAVADGMVRATAKSAATPEAMVDVLTGRLHALEKAHGLLRHSVEKPPDQSFRADLHALIIEITDAHSVDSFPLASRFSIEGPVVSCGEHATNGLALIVNELATNAVKYGSLSTSTGRVEIGWTVQEDRLLLQWREVNGPAARPNNKKGFGTTLIDRTIMTQFLGLLEREWSSKGLVVRMDLSTRRLAM